MFTTDLISTTTYSVGSHNQELSRIHYATIREQIKLNFEIYIIDFTDICR